MVSNTYMLGFELGPKFLRKLINWKILLTFWMILRVHTFHRHGSCYKNQQNSKLFHDFTCILLQPKSKIKWKCDVVSEITMFCTVLFIYVCQYDYVIWCDIFPYISAARTHRLGKTTITAQRTVAASHAFYFAKSS